MPVLLVHRDVDAHLDELDVSLREPVRQKVIWAEMQLAIAGRALRVKGTRAQAWRRTPVRGNEYYLWWAPADAVGAGSPELGQAIAVRDLRHHDRLVPPASAALQDYRVVHPRELDPRSAIQASVARDPPSSGVAATLVRGQPGTGKTLALLFAARALAASQRVLYVTYTPRLAEEARLFARANGMEDQLSVVTLEALEAAVLRDPPGAQAESPAHLAQRFETLVRSSDSAVVGPWAGKGHSLWAEARASLVGMALPFAWRRGALAIPPCEMLDRAIYLKVSGLDEDAAERAHHLAELARKRGLLADQTRARAALDALAHGDAGGLDLERVGAVLVDEVQDLTPVEIALLLEVAGAVARRRRSALFVAAGDDSQTVHPSGFAWGLAKDLIHQRLGREPADVVLDQPRRNPRAVFALVQKTAALYKVLSKELRPSTGAAIEVSEIADAGRVLWCEPPDDAAWKALLDAVVTVPGRALVTLGSAWAGQGAGAAAGVTFTPADIKGLERRTVLVAGLDEALGTLGRLTTRSEQEGRFLEGLEARHLVDGIRVALSRATETLVLLGPAPESPLAARLDLARDVESVAWADLRRLLEEDDLTEAERALGFLDEAHEHEARGDAARALERLGRAEAIARRLEDRAISTAVREMRERIDETLRPRLVVAPAGGDFASLQDAIGAAPAGARILVRPGTYRGPFMIERDLQIVGEGERASIVLESETITLNVDRCDVALENLTIVRRKGAGMFGGFGGVKSVLKVARQVGKALGLGLDEDLARVDPEAAEAVYRSGSIGTAISAGGSTLRLRGCDIDPSGGAGLIVWDGARVSAEACDIHNGSIGIVVASTGAATVAGCDVFENASAISVGAGARATIRACSVRSTTKDAITLYGGAEALIEKNEFSATRGCAVHVIRGAIAMVRDNRIHHGQFPAVVIAPGGQGIFEDNDLFDNGGIGFRVGAGADPTVRNNRIRRGGGVGIWVEANGRGLFEENQILDNADMGFSIDDNAEVTVRSSTFAGNSAGGLNIGPGARGTFEDNDISAIDATGSGIGVHPGACPILRRNRVHHHRSNGVIFSGSEGLFEGNEIFENGGHGLVVQEGAGPVVRQNRIHHNEVGIYVDAGGMGTFEDNEVHAHRDVGVMVTGGSGPTFRRNRIQQSGHLSVSIEGGARPTFEANDISEGGTPAAGAAVGVCTGADPTFRGNRIHHGPIGVMVWDGGLGVFEGNEIFSNGRVGVFFKDVAAPVLRGNRIYDSREYGVVIQFSGGTIEDNEIFKNGGVGLRTESMDVVVTGNRIHDNAGGGVFVQPDTTGLFERNEIASNKNWGVMVALRGNPTMRDNRVSGSPLGIVVSERALGTYLGNDVRGNKRLGLLIDPRSTPVRSEGNVSDPAPQAGKGGSDRSKRGRKR